MIYEKDRDPELRESETERLSRQLLRENIKRLQIIGLIGLPINVLLVVVAFVREGVPGLFMLDSGIRYLWIIATVLYLAFTGRIEPESRPSGFKGGVFMLAAMLCCLFASGITVHNVTNDTASLVYIVVVLLVGAFLFLDPASYMMIVLPGLVFLYVGLLSRVADPSRLLAILVNLTAIHLFSGVIVVFNMRMRERQFESDRALSRLNNELKALSELDGLTALPNRRKIDETLEFWKAVYARKPDSLAIIMLDVDHFKDFNDTSGHLAGDDALKKIAYIISTCLFRDADFVGRFGGEEFLIILPGITRLGAFTIAERVRLAVEDALITYEGRESKCVTVSAGIAYSEMCSREAFDPLINLADEALYDAKQTGRNRVVIRDMF